MTTAILTTDSVYYTEGQPEEVLAAIQRGELLLCWWYVSWGEQYMERCWFAEDTVKSVRSESGAVVPIQAQTAR